MKVQQLNAEEEFAGVIASVETDPYSWKDWLVLRLQVDEADAVNFQDIVICIRAVINTFPEDVEGTAYICHPRDVYIFCKNISENILHETGRMVVDMVMKDQAILCRYSAYDLASESQDFTKDILNASESFSISVVMNEDFEGAETGPTPNIKTLIVEDDLITRKMIERTLDGQCQIFMLDRANKVFATYQETKPDIVFLDIGLPDNTGYSVLEWIIRNDPAVPVIMLSGKGSAKNISRCMDMGAKGFVSKPFLKEDLLHYIRRYT